jgi:hypothetical protein
MLLRSRAGFSFFDGQPALGAQASLILLANSYSLHARVGSNRRKAPLRDRSRRGAIFQAATRT